MRHRETSETELQKKVKSKKQEDTYDDEISTVEKAKIVRRQSSLRYRNKGGRNHNDNSVFLTGRVSLSPQEHAQLFRVFRKNELDPFFTKTAWRFYCTRVTFFCIRFMKNLRRALIDDFSSLFEEKGKLIGASVDVIKRRHKYKLERFFELWTVSRDISEAMRTSVILFRYSLIIVRKQLINIQVLITRLP